MNNHSMKIADQKLEDLGLVIASNGNVYISDGHAIEGGYVHHSTVPVAVVGFALADKSAACARFPKLKLADVVLKRPAMDEGEVVALGRVCGVDVCPPFWGNAQPFADHLFALIEHYQLQAFFQVNEDLPDNCQSHYACRPAGWDFEISEEVPGGLSAWRKAYRALPSEKQMMVATIMWFYRGCEDKTWLSRVPNKWTAVDAVLTLQKAGCFKDWVTLMCLYPGW